MPRSRQRWPLLAGGAVLVAVVCFAIAWAGYRSAQAHDHLEKARDRVGVLQQHLLAGDEAGADEDVRVIQQEAARARDLSSSLVLRAIDLIPYFGRTTATARGLAAAADDLARGPMPALVDAATALSPDDLRSGDTIDIAAMRGVAGPLADAALQIDAVRRRLVGLASGSLVIDPVDRARTGLLRDVARLQGTVTVGARFAAAAPGMLGDIETRRYLVAVQDNAEARGTGGVIRAFAILEARRGRIELVQTGSARQLGDARRSVIDFGGDYDRTYGTDATRRWSASNQSPHFPYAAQTWARLWDLAHPEQPVDAVIGVDPRAFAGILRATGPVQVTRKTQVNTLNVVQLTEVEAAKAPNPTARAASLALASRAIIRAVLNGAGDSVLLGRALGTAARERHLAMWSVRTAEQQILEQTDYAGLLPETTQPFSQVVINNERPSRIDYFLRRTVSYFAAGCGRDGRGSTVIARISNDAPRGLPRYVTHTTADEPYAQNRVTVAVYATAGARLVSASLDTRPIEMTTTEERGHPVFRTTMTIDRRATRTLTVRMVEPSARGEPLVAVQPLATGQDSIIDVESC